MHRDGSGVRNLTGHASARRGNTDEAKRIYAALLSRSGTAYVSPVYLAIIQGALGDRDRAFEWLDRAYQEHAAPLLFLKVDPLFEPLRGDPRFAVLLRRMKLD